jgi:uncharacterized protein
LQVTNKGIPQIGGPVATGLIALLDDIAGLAKIAAASLDDAAAQAAKAGVKAAGIVIDDAAVTPRYVVGFAADRELPIVAKIAIGSLRNKLIFLLPGALLLSLFAPWAITPLLMAGGAYLCFEGFEKIHEALRPHPAAPPGEAGDGIADTKALADAKALEDVKVRGAINTDIVLSAEIMAITLSTVADASFWTQATVLAVVGIGITVIVYGGVALIVKADDIGVALALNARPVSSLLGLRHAPPGAGVLAPSALDRALRPISQGFGRGLVKGMPVFLKALSIVGTAAMLWVGGGIILHGLETFHLSLPAQAVHFASQTASHMLPPIAGLAGWLAGAIASGLFGLAVGLLVAPFAALAGKALKAFRT